MHEVVTRTRQAPPQALSWSQWAVLAGWLALLLFITDLAYPSSALHVWVWMRVAAPPEEQRYGFTARLAADHECVEVASVMPDGAFARAGVQPGCVPVGRSCFGTSQAESLFSRLRAARGADPVMLNFVPGGYPLDPCWPEQARTPIRLTVVAPGR